MGVQNEYGNNPYSYRDNHILNPLDRRPFNEKSRRHFKISQDKKTRNNSHHSKMNQENQNSPSTPVIH